MKFLIIAALAALTACTTASKREPSSTAAEEAKFTTGKEPLPAPELGEKWGPENDDQTNKIVALFIKMITDETKPGMTMHRDAHPKHHACVKAQLAIDASALPADQRTGLYAKRELYNAWIRFSNASPTGDAANDIDLDQHGMAVKILGVEGSPTGNHDLVMMDDERFFSKDGENYLPMTEALLHGPAAIIKFGLLHPRQTAVLLSSRHHTVSPLQSSYFSSTPYKLGSHSSRFMMKPCDQNDDYSKLPDSKTAPKNYLRERLVASVTKHDTCFEFFVEPNNDPSKNNVEDPTRVWDHEVSPFVKVGKIVIPVQEDPTNQAQMNFCENVSMDPWRAPSENRPLGQINRIRRLAYPRISAHRHSANQRVRVEPRSLRPCEDAATSDLCQSSRR